MAGAWMPSSVPSDMMCSRTRSPCVAFMCGRLQYSMPARRAPHHVSVYGSALFPALHSDRHGAPQPGTRLCGGFFFCKCQHRQGDRPPMKQAYVTHFGLGDLSAPLCTNLSGRGTVDGMEVLVAGAVVVGGERRLLVVGQRRAQLRQVLREVEAPDLVLDAVRQYKLAVHIVWRAAGQRRPLRACTASLGARSDWLERSPSCGRAMQAGTASQQGVAGLQAARWTVRGLTPHCAACTSAQFQPGCLSILGRGAPCARL